MRNLVPDRAIRLSAIALAAVAFPAISQTAYDPSVLRSDALYGEQRPRAGFHTTHALTLDWQSVDIYAVPNPQVILPNGRPLIEHVARRASGSVAGVGEVTWTTSRDCPELFNTLVWMTTLVAPRIDIAGVSPSEFEPAGRRPITFGMDGLQTTVWGDGTQPDHVMNTRVVVSSNAGLIAEFGLAATENLRGCWKTDTPVL